MEIFTKRRSVRKFKSSLVNYADLKHIADCGRLAPSPANLQPLKFHIITKKSAEIFEQVKWAGYLPDWNPDPEDAPPAYIAILGDTDIKQNGEFELDAGIAGCAMTFAAESLGLSSCWLGAINREKISEILKLSENLKLLYVIAFGYAAQESEAVPFDGSIKYTMDENGKIHVPKRAFNDVITED